MYTGRNTVVWLGIIHTNSIILGVQRRFVEHVNTNWTLPYQPSYLLARILYGGIHTEPRKRSG